MSDTESGTPRLRLAAIGVLVLTLTVGAGCASLMPGSSSTETETDLEAVPGDADSVVTIEVRELLESDALNSVGDNALGAQFGENHSEPGSVDAAVADAADRSGVDPANVESMTLFSKTRTATLDENAPQYTGAIVQTDLTPEEIVAAHTENNTTYSETSHAGFGLHVPEHSEGADTENAAWIGELADGEYVVGTEAAVKDSLATKAGDQEALDGSLKTAFANTNDGLLRYAVSAENAENATSSLSEVAEPFGVNASELTGVTATSGSVSFDGAQLTVEYVQQTEDTKTAKAVYDVTSGWTAIAREDLDAPAEADIMSEEHLSVERDGTAVSLTLESSPETLNAFIDFLYSDET